MVARGRPEDATSKGIQSVEIGYALLVTLSKLAEPASLKEIAQANGMTPSKAFFYLTSLVRVGLVHKQPEDGRYRLGIAALGLGLAAMAQVDPVENARASMGDLRNSVHQSVALAVWGPQGPTIVSRLPGFQWQLEVRLGAILSPMTATGRALMMSFPGPLLRSTVRGALATAREREPWSALSEREAINLCETDRARGIALGFGVVFPGATSLAAPVFDSSGNVVAALTILGDKEQFDTNFEGEPARTLLAFASRASARKQAPPATAAREAVARPPRAS